MKAFLSFFIVILTATLFGCKSNNEAVTENIRPVRYATITQSGGKDVRFFSGTAQASNETNLSFRVNGTISKLNVKLGDRVRKGQLIATIDPSDYNIQYEQSVAQKKGAEAQLQSSQTQIKSAESQLITTKSTYERVEKLYENNSVPLSEYEQAKAAYEAALEQHKAAKAQYDASQTQVTTSQKQIEASRNQVTYTRLTAPFNGVITFVNVEENELVGSGTPVAVISSEGKPEVNVGVPEIFINKIKKGQAVSITFSVLPNQPFDGVVEEVAYAAGASPTYPVIVRIVNPADAIRPGMAANVTFDFSDGKKVTSTPKTVAPVKSVGEDTEGNFVFVLEKSEESQHFIVKKRTVEIGNLVADGFEVNSGVEEGELVATAGLKSLLDGMKVKLLNE